MAYRTEMFVMTSGQSKKIPAGAASRGPGQQGCGRDEIVV